MDSNKKLTPAARRNLEQFLPDSSLAADIRAALADLDSAEGACSVFAGNEERCDVILRGLGLDDTVNVTPRLATLAAMYRTQCRANVSEAARADAAEQRVCELRTLVGRMEAKSEAGWMDNDHACPECVGDAAPKHLDGWRCARHSVDAALASTADIAGRWVSVEEHARLRDLFDQDGKALIRARTERDAAIARAERAERERAEAIEQGERDARRADAAHADIARAAAAERALDEVGIQLAAAQAEIARLHKGLRDVEGFMLREWRPPAEAVLAMVRDVAAGGPSVPGDALATKSRPPEAPVARRLAELEGLLREARRWFDVIAARDLIDRDRLEDIDNRITAALEASGIDMGNVKVCRCFTICCCDDNGKWSEEIASNVKGVG